MYDTLIVLDKALHYSEDVWRMIALDETLHYSEDLWCVIALSKTLNYSEDLMVECWQSFLSRVHAIFPPVVSLVYNWAERNNNSKFLNTHSLCLLMCVDLHLNTPVKDFHLSKVLCVQLWCCEYSHVYSYKTLGKVLCVKL